MTRLLVVFTFLGCDRFIPPLLECRVREWVFVLSPLENAVLSSVEECFSSVAFSSIVISGLLLPESFTGIGIAYKLTRSTFLAI